MEGNMPLSTGGKMIRDQALRHPMAALIFLAYGISWLAWLLAYRIDLGVVNGFGIIGSTGPALAAMIVTALVRPEPSGVPAGKRRRLFLVIGIIVFAVMVIRRLWITAEWLTVAGNVTTTVAFPTSVALLVDILAAAVVAFALSGVLSPRQGVHDLMHSLDPRSHPVRWYWWVIAVGVYPVVITIGNAISAGLGLAGTAQNAGGMWHSQILDLLLTFLYILLGGGGLEEPGWRGFALPQLQKRYSPLRSSLILAVIWAFWHWPLFWFDHSMGGPMGVVFFSLGVVPVAILFTAVFNRTGGSLPIVILLHSSINSFPIFMPVTAIASGLWWLLILCVAIWMWRSSQFLTISPETP